MYMRNECCRFVGSNVILLSWVLLSARVPRVTTFPSIGRAFWGCLGGSGVLPKAFRRVQSTFKVAPEAFGCARGRFGTHGRKTKM